MTYKDIVKRCVSTGLSAYLKTHMAGMDEESAFLFGKRTFEAQLQLEVHRSDLLVTMGDR